MVTITIDNQKYQVEENQTILQVATKLGIEIPFFCWHPKLSLSGNCRMCLVEVEKMPKLVIACMTQVTDGMVINTRNDRVITARQAVMEFLLINHPLDCPICDEAGECKLQDYSYTYSRGVSRFDETKVHKPKRVPLGPYVMLDVERCIMCSRCIRFSEEIAKQPALTFTQRGDHVVLTTFPDVELDNPYSMNVIDICPVGALTSRDFRFKSRVWEMVSTESICVGCARGCNTYIWTRNNKILRFTPRINEKVNDYWICDKGRLTTYQFVNDDLRVMEPMVKKNNKFVDVSWEAAINAASSLLKKYKSKEIAVVASPYSTNEDNYMLKKFAREVLKTTKIEYLDHIVEGDEDDILIRADKTPNSTGLKLIFNEELERKTGWDDLRRNIKEGRIKCLYVLNEDITQDEKIIPLLSKLESLIVHSWSHNKTTAAADVVFSSATYAEAEGTLTNFQGRVQYLKPAVVTKGRSRAAEGYTLSRLDKFGTKFDRWGRGPVRNARPAWQVISALATAGGGKFRYNNAREVFEELADTNNAFDGMTYQKIGRKGAEVNRKEYEKISA